MSENIPNPPLRNYNNGHHRVDVVDAAGSVEVETRPPVPKERSARGIVRPRMSISPLPQLKRANDPNRRNVKESYKKCKPSQYKRHMDLHVQTIFKYLSDRESRRKNLEAELQMIERTDDSLLGISRDIIKTKRLRLRLSESDYLRSLRSKLSPNDFETKAELGRGYMGSVSLVEKKSPNPGDPDLFAMKKIKKSQVYQQNHMAHVMAERDILAEADNEWIVKLYYSFQDEQSLYFILEYLPGGDMIGLLCLKSWFNEEWARFYIAEISLAVQFVHDMGYIHRDIKPDNILIDSNGHIKLTDFGLCTGFRWTHDSKYYIDDTLSATLNSAIKSAENYPDEHMTITRELIKREIEHSRKPRTLSLVGSPNYIAPEVLRQACYRQQSTNEKLCDWWSVGVILYEMVVGHCPFVQIDPIEKYDINNTPELIQDRILRWKDYLRFPPLYDEILREPRQLSNQVVDLIKGLLCDPEDRLCHNGINDLHAHPFFEHLDWINIRSTKAPHMPALEDRLDTRYFQTDNPLPEQTFNSSKIHGPMVHFTFKNFRN